MTTSRLEPWRHLGSERVHDCRVFDLRKDRFEPPDGSAAADFFVVEAPDWINVIPLTRDDRVVMIRQYRFGISGFTLEIPGGMCDPGESPEEAARRELREETGYVARRIEPIGWVHPNPAVQTNRCHTFLAREIVAEGAPSPDDHEEFEVVTYPLSEVPRLIASGAISHSLVVTAFYLLGLRRPASSMQEPFMD